MAMDPDLAFSGITDPRHQHGLKWLQRPFISTGSLWQPWPQTLIWSLLVAQTDVTMYWCHLGLSGPPVVSQIMDIYMNLGLQNVLGQQHRPQIPTWPREAPQTIKEVQFRKWTIFQFILDILWLCLHKLRATTHHHVVPTRQWHVPVHRKHLLALVPSFFLALTTPFLPLSHLSIAFSYVVVALETAVCHTVYIHTCPNSMTCKYSLQWVAGPVQGFWFMKQHKYWTTAETRLGYPAVA